MPFVLVSAAKDLRRRLADPVALAIWIGIPLVLGGMMALISGTDSAPPTAKVLVADLDDSVLSGFVVTAAGSGGFLDVEAVSETDGMARMQDGDATALLVIPSGFQRAVLDETPATLQLVTHPGQRILPGIVREGVEILAEGVFYVQQLFGDELRRIANDLAAGGSPLDADVAAVSVAINQRLRALEGTLLPPVLSLEVARDENADAPQPSFGQLFLPGILFMSILFIAQGVSLDIWRERAKGTLRRALTTPQSTAALLGGKLVAGAVLVGLITLVALVASTLAFGVAWSRLPAALLWAVFSGAAMLALFTWLQMLATSERGANLLSTIVVFPLIMIGGSFFPFEAMPPWMAAVGAWTPNGLALLRLKGLLFGEFAPAALATAAIGIGLPALAAFLLSARQLRRRFAVTS